jgi:hypothetical protein
MKLISKPKRYLNRQLSIIGLSLLVGLPNCFADTAPAAGSASGDTNKILTVIAGYTASILSQINQLPAYIQSITQMADSWLGVGDSTNSIQVIGDNQLDFTKLMTTIQTARSEQNQMASSLTSTAITLGSYNVNKPLLPANANSLVYSIAVANGTPLTQSDRTAKAPNPPKLSEYIRYLSGVGITLPQPSPTWPRDEATNSFSEPTAKAYEGYYNMAMAIQSYNAYVFSELNNQQQKSAIQDKLTSRASAKDWFLQIATEPLGVVLREILMYQSQSYVALTQLIALQQQQLMATTITNSLSNFYLGQTMGIGLAQQAQAATNKAPAATLKQ